MRKIPSLLQLNRRQFMQVASASAALSLLPSASHGEDAPSLSLVTFSADVTVPIGHALMGGGIAPAAKVEDPLEARGLVLFGAGKPVVICAVDWCEIRNDAYDRWRDVLAGAAGTERVRVMVTALHQHDAPIADLTAQGLLEEAKARGSICDLKFHEEAVQRVAAAVKKAVAGEKRKVTHIGTGQAKVEMIASNRRYIDDAGNPNYGRMSRTGDPKIRAKPEGDIDPWLKTISFWAGDKPLVAISTYATHPMSYYGRGGVSGDFVSLARRQREKDVDSGGAFQIYVSGCSGNVTAGKYNDGATENRKVLADRLHKAMKDAWNATKREPVKQAEFRSVAMKLAPRDGPGFTADDLKKRITLDRTPFGQCLAALGLSWRMRCDKGQPIDVPVLDFGHACYLVMPAEAYVEFQLAAQKVRPDTFVAVAGYGESGPGYIPIERAWKENDGNLHDWCWVAPGSEKVMIEAMEKVLKRTSQ